MKWEYKIKEHDYSIRPDTRETMLNDMGHEGWELINVMEYVHENGFVNYEFYFKRRI